MNKIYLKCFFILIPLVLISCDILRDKPFEVVSWSPGSGVHTELNNIKIGLRFSHDTDMPSVEKSFTLREGSETLKGSFSWNGTSMTFYPASPLLKNKDYEILLSTDAQAKNGLSLEERFEAKWTTRSGIARPQIKGITPEDGTVINDKWQKISIRFSEAVDALTCGREISITPSIKGTWQIEEDGFLAVWTPEEQWKFGRRYTLAISEFFESAGGKSTGKNYEARWVAGSDAQAPVLTAFYAIDSRGNNIFTVVPDNPETADATTAYTENKNFEKDYKFRICWDEPVGISKLKNFLSFEPALKFNVDPPFGYKDTAVITLVDVPEWGGSFNIKLKSGISDETGNISNENFFYRVTADGIYSMPPKLLAVRLAWNTNDCIIFSPDALYEYIDLSSSKFPYETDTQAFFELYFDTAEGAVINMFSLMDLLKINVTNSCLNFSIKSIVKSNFTESVCAAGFEDKQRLEVRGILRNTANEGVVNFIVGKGLLDSNGNTAKNEMKIQLLK